MPKWMAGIDAFTAPKAFGLAALLGGVNPKNLLLAPPPAPQSAKPNLSGGEVWLALAIFVVLASLTVAIPVVYYAVGGEGRPAHHERVEGLAAAQQPHRQ